MIVAETDTLQLKTTISKEKKTKKNINEKEKSVKEKYIEMKEQIKLYRKNLNENLMNGTKTASDTFNSIFFKSLENLIIQVDMYKDDVEKSNKVSVVYNWYIQKTKFFHDMNNINRFSAKQYFETIPDISLIKKSDIYEARNYPIEYEKENRTEIESMLPPKDRLKEFMTKKIIPPKTKKVEKEVLEDDPKKITSERLPSAHSNLAVSTHYSSNFNTTTNKFFNQTATGNKFYASTRTKFSEPIEYNREIKTSHGYYRPKYETNNLDIQKQWGNEKHRELAEKKHKEEVKEFLNEWGFSKSRQIEEVERKNELKLLLKNYEKINLKAQGKQNQEEENMDDDNEKNEEDDQEQNIDIETQNPGVVNNVRNLNSTEVTNDIHKPIIVDLKKAIIGSEAKGNLGSSLKNRFEKNFPLEVASVLNNDKLSKARKLYGNVIDIQEIDNQKHGEYYSSYKHALSIYDNYNDIKDRNFNEKQPVNSINYKIFTGSRPNTVHELINPLRQRRTLSAFEKLNDLNILKNDLNKANVSIPLKSLKEALVSPDANKYPKYFLPTRGFGLFKNPIPDKPKGKRPRSKKA